jgi:hypothetical protein
MTTPEMPEPRLKGRFNVYETPDGGLHIAYQPDPVDDQEQEIQHIEIPAKVIKLAQMINGGKMNPLAAMGSLGLFK